MTRRQQILANFLKLADFSRDDILKKIKKLLALSSGNANENEGATAKAMAERLMAKHNISPAEVQVRQPPPRYQPPPQQAQKPPPKPQQPKSPAYLIHTLHKMLTADGYKRIPAFIALYQRMIKDGYDLQMPTQLGNESVEWLIDELKQLFLKDGYTPKGLSGDAPHKYLLEKHWARLVRILIYDGYGITR